ncbi:MAG: formylmethanofuran--tetrahydromethanopterin N-formyltransferase [Planctomycetaceae bacterium]|nr:formylmethanofuran--tetrahydromethanopterin N-formyltransferase [Planctomycetales bacterium]MCB9926051.1 formylmethanofuran--tetrahydromethanopterin N-formyltransferase [Planctomycetaceae bacterium]
MSIVEDTYAEAFKSLYSEVLITARDHKWLEYAVNAATGNASSTIMCDCEAGVDRFVGPGGDGSLDTPDGRPGAVVQFHVPRFRKDRVRALEKAMLTRISQNVLTCPTTACFNLLASDDYFKLGRKIAYFGDGYEKVEQRNGRDMWVLPTMGGEFTIDRRFGYADGIMGGNLWFMGASEEAAIEAAEAAAHAVDATPGVITTFPGGVAASASKAGSKYKFLFASTYDKFCPTLKQQLGEASGVPEGVRSIMEIIINGRDLATVAEATYNAIDACLDTPGLVKVSAGNYNGRLGKSFIYLHRRDEVASSR